LNREIWIEDLAVILAAEEFALPFKELVHADMATLVDSLTKVGIHVVVMIEEVTATMVVEIMVMIVQEEYVSPSNVGNAIMVINAGLAMKEVQVAMIEEAMAMIEEVMAMIVQKEFALIFNVEIVIEVMVAVSLTVVVVVVVMETKTNMMTEEVVNVIPTDALTMVLHAIMDALMLVLKMMITIVAKTEIKRKFTI
jgi:hypothetical protein